MLGYWQCWRCLPVVRQKGKLRVDRQCKTKIHQPERRFKNVELTTLVTNEREKTRFQQQSVISRLN